MADKPELPIMEFISREALEQWLEENHAASEGVWLKIANKDSGAKTVTYAEAVELGLCYGWIDSQAKGFDKASHLQRFTPRRARSKWSQINREKAEALIADGRMKPSGLAEVERARADGRWEAAYAGQASMAVPEDLLAALENNPNAGAFFETLDSRNRYAILYRINDAKKPETRARRIEKFVGMLNRQEKVYS